MGSTSPAGLCPSVAPVSWAGEPCVPAQGLHRTNTGHEMTEREGLEAALTDQPAPSPCWSRNTAIRSRRNKARRVPERSPQPLAACPMLCHLALTMFCLIEAEPPLFQLAPIAPRPVIGCHQEEPGSVLLTVTLGVLKHAQDQNRTSTGSVQDMHRTSTGPVQDQDRTGTGPV